MQYCCTEAYGSLWSVIHIYTSSYYLSLSHTRIHKHRERFVFTCLIYASSLILSFDYYMGVLITLIL